MYIDIVYRYSRCMYIDIVSMYIDVVFNITVPNVLVDVSYKWKTYSTVCICIYVYIYICIYMLVCI